MNAFGEDQFPEPVVTMNREKLASTNSHVYNEEHLFKTVKCETNSKGMTSKTNHMKDDEKDTDEMIIKCDEEINLLEGLLRELEYAEEITTSDGKCSQVLSEEKVSIASMKINNCFNFQINQMFAGIEQSVDEHEVVIRLIEHKLFLESGVKIQRQQEDVEQRFVLKNNEEEEVAKYNQQRVEIEHEVQKEVRVEKFAEVNSQSIVEQWKRNPNVLNIF